MRCSIFILAITLVGLTRVQAQVVSDTTVALDPVTVIDSLSRGASEIRIEILGTDRIRLYPGETLASILDAESFLFVRRSGPSGLSTVSMRGTGPNHTRLYLDGLLLNDPQTGQVDVSTLPLTIVESIRVGHGGAAVENGRSALGGSIALRTVKPTRKRSLRTTLTGGAYGYRQLGGLISGPTGPVRSVFAFDSSREDGDFGFVDPGSFPRKTSRRENAWSNARHYYGHVETGEDRAIEVSGLWSVVRRGLPGPANAAPTGASQRDEALRLWSSFTQPIKSGRLDVTASASRTTILFSHPVSARSSLSTTRSVSFGARVSRVLSPRWLVKGNAALRLDGTDLKTGRSEGETTGLLSVVHTRDRFGVTSSAALTTIREGGNLRSSLDPSFSVRLVVDRRRKITVRASIASTFRNPTFNERFWSPGGNPDLIPETGRSLDASIQWVHFGSATSLDFEATLYHSVLTNRIVWQPALAAPNLQVWRPVNIGRVVGSGAEIALEVRHRVGHSTTVTLRSLSTYAGTVDLSDPAAASYGNQIRYSPRSVVKNTFGVSRGVFRLDVTSSVTGKQFLTTDESRAIGSFHQMSIQSSILIQAMNGFWRFAAGLENALDTTSESIRFYPMPPRHIRLSVVFDISQPDP